MVRANREVVTLPKHLTIVIPVLTIVNSPDVTAAIISFSITAIEFVKSSISEIRKL